MPRIAKRPEPKSPLLEFAGSAAAALGNRISENPSLAGAGAAFAVVMFFVSSNALFYQPFQHKDALFSTRSMDGYEAPVLPKPQASLKANGGKSEKFNIARDSGQGEAAGKADPSLADIQSALAKMNLYAGTVDGLPGPKTRAAIQKFQKEAGLQPTGEIDPLLIDAIRTASVPSTKVPAPSNKAKPAVVREETVAPEPNAMNDADVMKIQAGLKSFGNDDIGIDGKIGEKTRLAVREFQTLFQLTVTGEPNREVFNKLQEIGLISG
jgi:peptidoglycan hydrolase-like protein with peptidoglycan-binding domain